MKELKELEKYQIREKDWSNIKLVDMKKLLEEHYEALITISNSIYVNMPYRISNLSEFILSKRKEVSN